MSGGADPSPDNGPECYTSADCPNWRECSAGVCVGYTSCDNGCRNNEDCLDNVCRLQCESNSDCDNQGLICGTDTKHCKPGKNPTRPTSQPQSGTGGTGSTGSGGTTSSGTGATASTGSSAGGMAAGSMAGMSNGVAGQGFGSAAGGSPGYPMNAGGMTF